MKYAYLLALTLSVLAGCNNKPKTEPLPPQIIQEERQALDKAKGVGETIGKQAEEQRKQAEEATK